MDLRLLLEFHFLLLVISHLYVQLVSRRQYEAVSVRLDCRYTPQHQMTLCYEEILIMVYACLIYKDLRTMLCLYQLLSHTVLVYVWHNTFIPKGILLPPKEKLVNAFKTSEPYMYIWPITRKPGQTHLFDICGFFACLFSLLIDKSFQNATNIMFLCLGAEFSNFEWVKSNWKWNKIISFLAIFSIITRVS
jgi:hypothetical protein